MDESVVARRYARAFYRTSRERRSTAEVIAGLGEFASVFGENEALRTLLLHPGVPAEERDAVLARFARRGDAREFLAFLLRKGRLELLPLVQREMLSLYRRDEGIVAVEVTTAVPLTDKLRLAFEAALRKLTGKKVELVPVVDDKVVGGVRIRIGDHVMDDTLAARLDGIRGAMSGADV